jgi:hypothetical protein
MLDVKEQCRLNFPPTKCGDARTAKEPLYEQRDYKEKASACNL